MAPDHDHRRSGGQQRDDRERRPGPPRTETPSGKRQRAAEQGDHRDLGSEERQQRAASRAQVGDCRKERADRQRRAGEHEGSSEQDEDAAPALRGAGCGCRHQQNLSALRTSPEPFALSPILKPLL